MGFFDFLKQANINQGIEEYKKTAGAALLDVRTPQEYQEGHIPESKNVPLQQLTVIPEPEVVKQLGCCNEWDILK